MPNMFTGIKISCHHAASVSSAEAASATSRRRLGAALAGRALALVSVRRLMQNSSRKNKDGDSDGTLHSTAVPPGIGNWQPAETAIFQTPPRLATRLDLNKP